MCYPRSFFTKSATLSFLNIANPLSVKASYYHSQIEQLIQSVQNERGEDAGVTTFLSADELRSVEQLNGEHQLFSKLPQIVAHGSQLPNSGDYLVLELAQRSILLVRGKDGVARAFLNYCQHRGTKLVQDKQGCKARFSCPYHAWTYDATGALVGVPRADLFPGLNKVEKQLKALKLEEFAGFLWLTLDSAESTLAITEYLRELSDDLQGLNLQSHHVYFDKTRSLQANWKLPIYAFLESYHIATLHKDSIADFFLTNIAVSEQFGPHIRSFVPRKNVLELESQDWSEAELPEFVTPTHIVFPNVCLIAHPTSYTVIIMQPGDEPGTSTWRHMLLVPEMPSSDAARAHYDKTIRVLDGMTYENEDMWASEQIQQGVNAGAIDEMTLAAHEHLIKVFSENVSSRLKA